MTEIPDDAKQPTGFTKFGLDRTGQSVLFGFKCPDGDIRFAMDYTRIGHTILYLRKIANEAQKRRLRIIPNAEHTEFHGTPINPAKTVEFLPAVTGEAALLTVTNQDGTEATAQFDFELVTRLYSDLPRLIAEMQRRQAAATILH